MISLLLATSLGICAGAFPAFAAQTNYDSGDPTPDEQYVLEMINRARANPTAEGTRLGININEGISGATAVVRPPLAMSKILLGTARAHSADMYTRKFFAHTNPDGKDPFDRIDGAGYNGSVEGENIGAGSSHTAAELEDLLMRDNNYPGRGHRVNLLSIGNDTPYREIGIGYYSGATVLQPLGLKDFLTQDFGMRGTAAFVVGVVYNDANHNGFYDPGEGLAGVQIVPDSGDFKAVTGTAGGYAIPVGTSGTLVLTASGPGLPVAQEAQVTLAGMNLKVDFTSGAIPTVTPAILKGQVKGQPAGTLYSLLGAPQSGPFIGTMQAGTVKTAAIFAGDGSVRIKAGNPAPLVTGSIVSALHEPGGDAAIALLKTGPGGVTARTNRVLLGGLANGPVVTAARTGQDVTGLAGVKIKSILQFDGAGPDYFFTALLEGTGVTPESGSALCVATGDGSVRVVMREGQMLGARSVSTIGAFITQPGSLAEARWRSSVQSFGVRVTFADKGQQYFTVPSSAASSADWAPWLKTGDSIGGTIVRTLGFPGFGSSGPAGVVAVKSGTTAVAAVHDTLLVRCDAGGTTVLATEGNPAPDANGADILGATFKTFSAPVCGPNGRTAFAATLVGTKDNAGIWLSADGMQLRQIARIGANAPGGGEWAKFTQIVLTDDVPGSVYFTGTLRPDRALGVSAANNTGLWAMGSSGEPVLLLRTNQAISVNGTSRLLKSFVALSTTADSAGTAHGYDAEAHIVVKATFSDHSIVLMRLAVPTLP